MATQKIHCISLVSIPPTLLPLRKVYLGPVFNCSTLVVYTNYVVMTDKGYLNKPADCHKAPVRKCGLFFI